MIGLAADDASQGDIAVIAGGGRETPGLLGQGDGGRYLQRPRNRDEVEGGAIGAQRILRPFQQGVGQTVIEARLDNEDAIGVVQDWSSPSMSRQPTMRRP